MKTLYYNVNKFQKHYREYSVMVPFNTVLGDSLVELKLIICVKDGEMTVPNYSALEFEESDLQLWFWDEKVLEGQEFMEKLAIYCDESPYDEPLQYLKAYLKYFQDFDNFELEEESE